MENVLFVGLALVCLVYAVKCRLDETDTKRDSQKLQKRCKLLVKGIGFIYRSLNADEQKKLRDLVQRKVYDDTVDVLQQNKSMEQNHSKVVDEQKREEDRQIWKEVYRHLCQ